MSILKVKGNSKWTKDTYGLYPKPKARKTKGNNIQSREKFYKRVYSVGRNITHDSNIAKKMKWIYKESNQKYIKRETLEKVLISFKHTNQIVEKNSNKYNEILHRNLVKNKVNKKVIMRPLPDYNFNGSKTSNVNKIKSSHKNKMKPVPKKENVQSNTPSTRKKARPHQEKLNYY